VTCLFTSSLKSLAFLILLNDTVSAANDVHYISH
jgi:hypothetical protein